MVLFDVGLSGLFQRSFEWSGKQTHTVPLEPWILDLFFHLFTLLSFILSLIHSFSLPLIHSFSHSFILRIIYLPSHSFLLPFSPLIHMIHSERYIRVVRVSASRADQRNHRRPHTIGGNRRIQTIHGKYCHGHNLRPNSLIF